jgi:hypothetical protein
MRLTGVHIRNFRCLTDLQLNFDDVTVLVGANSTGKSTALHALRWLFEGGSLDDEDIAGCQTGAVVSVGATFKEFTDADRDALGSYVLGDEATFWRTWSSAEGEKLTGRGRAYPPFEHVRQQAKALEKRKAYNELRAAQPDLALPTATSQQAVEDAMKAWEDAHPDHLEESRVSATHLFGFTGGSRLNGRFDLVLVPAVSDPTVETRDARGTLLRQLLDRAMGDQAALQERLQELEETVSSQMHEIVVAEGGEALSDLSESVSKELARLIPSGEVSLEARPPTFRVPDLTVDLRVTEGGLQTGVSRQGQGFQRALLIAVVQQLGALRPAKSSVGDTTPTSTSPEPPALFLALEEPELYQHPLQARHFAATLAGLASAGAGAIQVAYATHSEHFVDPARYDRLRRFRRRSNTEWPVGEVTQATIAGVADRLAGIVASDEVATRTRVTLRRQLAEAIFARGVVLVEGHADAGFIQGIGDRDGGLDADGIAVVAGLGKTNLPIPWAILAELGLPTFVVFDGDAGRATRLRDQGKVDEADQATIDVARENRKLLQILGATPEDNPRTTVAAAYAVFSDHLESEASLWPGYIEELDRCKVQLADWRGKSDDAYRHAAAGTVSDPPEVFTNVIRAIRGLA